MPRPDEKVERNRAIVGAYLDGVPHAELARRHGLVPGRIACIIAMYKLRALRYNRDKERTDARTHP